MTAPLNNKVKLELSLQDIPTDIDVLKHSIKELTALLLEEALLLDDVYLTSSQARILNYIMAREQVVLRTASQSPKSDKVLLSQLRIKLASKDAILPRQGQPLTKETKEKIASMIVTDVGRQDIRKKLQSLLPFDPCRFDAGKLPTDILSLQTITLKLMEFVRGNPARMTPSFISESRTQKILVSALLARKGGIATTKYLFSAIYPPYLSDAPYPHTLIDHLHYTRKSLRPYGLEMTSHGGRGFSFDEPNRQRALNLAGLNEDAFTLS